MINENLIFVNTDFNSQEEIFHFLAEEITDQGGADDSEAVYKALKKRESEGTTGMMDGFAIPHAKSSSIISPKIAIIKQEQPLDWDSLDGKPTYYIIAMFIPDSQAGTAHLTILSQVARMLMKEDFKMSFEQANTKKDLMRLIADRIEGE
ncbi:MULTISPECIES: fructose PTS transporter subunit IIA [Enterococcus]|uniref:fructose PTS transporter subunit IIA n=1 Tax=Enterococcus TaxID=1350 RepID=UPI0002A1A731|nr:MULTISPECIES: fructose PTS transporter subunit IIA [Enterococcus]ELB05472.1 PTS system, fructose subfamily, IIA component [Enterococcus faecium EnGen0028]MDT6323817.1 fructose PTS transporter subunit IIA [Enterococcus faecium]HAQ4672480.1 PTS transporter subunit EIIA [Enterococcus faecium]HAQ4706629.1 PTS transporter subunit EIIA [Enterococcus faecium]HAR1638595.1 PTS transporter subunit EIIA [Enterococcus faecium]